MIVMQMVLKQVDILGIKTTIAGFEEDPYFAGVGSLENTNSFLNFALSKLPVHSTVFDVGANVGYTTSMLARTVRDGLVHSFEPSPKIFPCLEKTIMANNFSNCNPHNVGLGAKSGRFQFFENETSASTSHVAEEDSLSFDVTDITKAKTVAISTVDEQADLLGLSRLDFIKIDVEGFELAVINGASKAIERFRPKCFVEFNSFTMIAFRNMNPRDLLEKLTITFPYVYGWDGAVPYLISSSFTKLHFIHSNLIKNGCVDDLCCSFEPIIE